MGGTAPSALAGTSPKWDMLQLVDIKFFTVPFGGGRVGAVMIHSGKIMPAKRSNPGTMRQAVKLRKVTTPAEKKLWSHLRGDKLNGVNFRRQHAIGNFIVDFVSIKKKLIIELDGSRHLEQAEYDVERTKYLEAQGYKIVRFWNGQVKKDVEGVVRVIEVALSGV